MKTTGIIIFFAVVIGTTVLFVYGVNKRKKKNKNKLQSGEDITDTFFRHLDDL